MKFEENLNRIFDRNFKFSKMEISGIKIGVGGDQNNRNYTAGKKFSKNPSRISHENSEIFIFGFLHTKLDIGGGYIF